MKLKNTPLAALTCASLFGSVALLQAEVLVSEDFSYGDGGLNGQSGGTGFSSTWSSSTNVTGGVVTGNDPSTRDLSAAFPSSGTLWVSFDWGNSGQPSQDGSYGGLTFYIGGSEKFLIGNTWPHPASHAVWQMNGASPTSVPNYPGMQTAVAKITLGAGATSTVELWIGPTGSPVDVSAPPLITSTGRELEGVNRLRINGGDFGGVGNTQSFDNLRIGTTVADVDATDAPPAPITATWTNPAGGPWDTTSNWLSDIVATGGGSTADFNTLDITGDTTVHLDSARTISNLIFGDTDTATAAGWTLTNNATLGNTLTLAGTTPTVTVNALGAAESVEISAVIAGIAGLTKSGPGSLVLSAANTYSGTTTVSHGTLQISGQPYFNIGRATSVASGAVLELNNSNNTFISLMPVSSISGAGTFRLTGNSTINQELNGTVSDRLTFAMDAGGMIDLQDTSRLVNGGWKQMKWTNNNASMNIASGATFDIWDGLEVRMDALTGSGAVVKGHPDPNTFLLTLGVANGSGTFSGTIQNTSGAGAIALTKVGSGTQTLSGTSTFIGNTSVNDGTLNIASSGSLRFRPTGNGVTNALSGSETATLSYLGTVDLDLSAANTSDGNFWILIDLSSFSGPVPTLEPVAVTSTLGSFTETETDSGIWELTSPSDKWTFSEVDGSLSYEVTATDYEIWGDAYGLAAGSEAGDLDNDGLTNFEEYAFGLIPDSGSSVNPIAAPLDKSAGTFSYTRRADSGLAYSVWYSTDLGTWLEDSGALEGAATPNGEVETVPVTISAGLLANPKLFIQVRAD